MLVKMESRGAFRPKTPFVNKLITLRQHRAIQRITRTFSAPITAGALTGTFLIWVIYRWLLRPNWIITLPPLSIELLDLMELGATVTLIVLWAVLGWRYVGELRRGRPPTIEELQALSPSEFEEYVAKLFRQKGYLVAVRGRSGDLGVDLEVTGKNGKRGIVQCKRYQRNIGPEIVRELYGTFLHERVTRAFLVTTAEISQSARRWAIGKPLTLIDGQSLVAIARSLHETDIAL